MQAGSCGAGRLNPPKRFMLGGLSAVEADTVEKDQFLKKLGINVNLAPVADVSTSVKDFIEGGVIPLAFAMGI